MIIGVGNGDPGCHEPDVYLSRLAPRSGTMNLWRMNTVAKSKEPHGLTEKFDDERWAEVETSGESNRLAAGESGVFRAQLFVSDEDLTLTNILLRFGAIRGEGRIYVNGNLAEGATKARTVAQKVLKRARKASGLE